ncbi:MAG: ABC transporter ATP-binding protein [Anaerolineales bacterium]|jgi:ABC-type lipoprotein export system ATPase subunit
MINCENLVKIYKQAELEVIALQGLDLVVELGEMVGVVGPSGSGKSTLLNILGGLDAPTAGRVRVDGRDLLKISRADLNLYRRLEVGFVWQLGSRNLLPYLRAIENVELPMTLAGVGSGERRRRAEELLKRVGLMDRRAHRLMELSGGEQQRVAIAVALANRPRLLLADEPTGEVDTDTAADIYKLFRDLNQDLQLTILVVSHDLNIHQYVDRMVTIRDGKLSTETVRQADHHPTKSRGLSGELTPEEGKSDLFEERIVLDSVGRLQLPKEYLERYDITGRVHLEPTEEGILIRPTGEKAHRATQGKSESDESVVRQRSSFQKLFHRLRLGGGARWAKKAERDHGKS